MLRRWLLLWLCCLSSAWAAEARFLSQVVPDEVAAGERFAVVVQFRNESRRSWDGAVALRQEGSRRWGRVRVPLRETVAPGEIATFKVTLKAPRRPGRYPLRWRLTRDGRPFGPRTPAVEVAVVAQPARIRWDAEFVHQSLPGLQQGEPPFAVLERGRPYGATVVFKNSGSRPWQPGEVRLVPLGQGAALTWSVGPLDLDRVVAPGEIHAFRFNLLTPLEPGIYPFQWRLERRGRGFGPASPKVMVTVR